MKRDQAPTQPPEAMRVRFYNQPHAYYCGCDLHARTLLLHGEASVTHSPKCPLRLGDEPRVPIP